MKKSKLQEPTLNQQIKGNNKSSNSKSFEVNIPIESSLSRNVDFPSDGCQIDILYHAKEIAESYQCPLEFVLIPMINVFSSIAGNTVILNDGKFMNAPAHNIVVVAPSGSNKSQPMKYALKPLLKLNHNLYEDWKAQKRKWNEDKSESKEEEPKLKQIIISDSTPEAKNQALCDNPNGILEYSDEIATKMNNVGRYSNTKDFSAELSLWDSTDVIVNRKGEDAIVVQTPFYSVMGTIQPSIVASVFGTSNLVNSGYVQRWLWIYPDIYTFPQYKDSIISPKTIEAYEKSVRNFYSVIQGTKYLEVSLTDDAKELYKEYYNKLQEKKTIAEDDYSRAIYAKLSIQCLRWALSLHILEWAMNTVEKKEVLSAQTMEYAIKCMDYFEYTAFKVQNLINGDKPMVQLTKQDVLKRLFEFYPNINQSELARTLGTTQQYISKTIK